MHTLNKPSLHENFSSMQPAEPSSRGHSSTHYVQVVTTDNDHPAEEIDRRNGWKEANDLSDEESEFAEKVRAVVITESVRGYGEIFYFCYSGASGTVMPIHTKSNLEVAFRRFVALTHLLFPELLVDDIGILSQRKVANVLGKSTTYLADLGTRFCDNWKFYSRVQKTKTERDTSRMARLHFLAAKKEQPRIARKPNGKAIKPNVGLCSSSPSSSAR